MNLKLLIHEFLRPEETVDLRTGDNRLIAKLADQIELLGASERDIIYGDKVTTVYWLNRKKLMSWLNRNAVGLSYEVRGTKAGKVMRQGESAQSCAEVIQFSRESDSKPGDRAY
jgi:hypothetical protein